MIPRREEPGGTLGRLGAESGEQACPAEQPHHPALAADGGRGRCRLGARAPVEPGDGRGQGAAVGGGRHQGGTLADDADGARLHRALHGGLGAGNPDPADERRPPGVRALLGAAGRAVEQERVRNPGEATKAAVRGKDARLHGGGPEVDGDEDAGIGGHDGDGRGPYSILPGLRIPSGSRAALIARITRTASAPRGRLEVRPLVRRRSRARRSPCRRARAPPGRARPGPRGAARPRCGSSRSKTKVGWRLPSPAWPKTPIGIAAPVADLVDRAEQLRHPAARHADVLHPADAHRRRAPSGPSAGPGAASRPPARPAARTSERRRRRAAQAPLGAVQLVGRRGPRAGPTRRAASRRRLVEAQRVGRRRRRGS